MIFDTDLLPNEKLVWSGQPTGKLLGQADWLLIPFSLLWGGFAVFWELSVLKQDASSGMAVFGIPFVLVGLYITFGRFIYKKYQKKYTYYAVTNKRVIIKYLAGRGHLLSVGLTSASTVKLSRYNSEIGTLYFGPSDIQSKMYGNTGMELLMPQKHSMVPAFYDIVDADKVYKIVSQIIVSDSNDRAR